jgi:cellulose synthase/poly-beta-1,6-N-acetylglucosamine synthase-like glycosyltransferase
VKASVIIPVYNDPRIEACILSLLGQDYPKELYEIIVVDNKSNDSIQEIIQRFDVKYVRENRKGSYFARNKGIEIASGDVAAFIDADCVADLHWLSHLLEGFKDSNVGGIGGRILKLKPQTWVQANAEDLVEQQLTPQYLPFHDAPYIVTANAAYSLALLQTLEGFDTQFQSGGDVDLSWRVQAKGFKIVTTPDAIVYHAARETVRGYFKQFFNYAVGHTLLYRKHCQTDGWNLFVNIYPFRGLKGLMFSSLPIMFVHILLGKSRTTRKKAHLLDLVKYVAIISGNVYGAIKYRIPYL